ncbi:MAG: hypothetical protein WCG27_07405, partial [Pseudomonadota bacterium]
MAFKVFEDVESYLKNSDWCYYRHNSQIMDILGNYKKNLPAHLENKEVLKVIAERTQSGSLIRIKINHQVKGVDLKMEVIGENGEDLYFKEETQLNTDDLTIVGQTIKNWFAVYQKIIPYDARISGILGEQFTLDAGKNYGLLVNDEVVINRSIQKKKHPLLKEIVDWDKEKIAKGRIFFVGEDQAQGRITEYYSKKKLFLEDWATVERKEAAADKKEGQPSYVDEEDKLEFGKLGQIAFFFNLGSGSATFVPGGSKSMGGLIVGGILETELWATRNIFLGVDFGQNFTSYKKKDGDWQNEAPNVTMGRFKIRSGYRYLPLGFFYGPQVDAYLGYANYSYNIPASAADKIAGGSFKGIFMGARGDMPIIKATRLYLKFDFLLFAKKYVEDTS